MDAMLSHLEVEKWAATAIITRGKKHVRILFVWDKYMKKPTRFDLIRLLFKQGERELDKLE